MSEPFKLKRAKQVIPEKYIENQIMSYLLGNGVFVWKNENGGVFDPNRGKFRAFGKYRLKGLPDIQGVLPPNGRTLAIEVKTQTGRVSPEQKLVVEKMTKLGAIAFIARSLEDVMKRMHEIKPTLKGVTNGNEEKGKDQNWVQEDGSEEIPEE
jgi:hypothetical protein